MLKTAYFVSLLLTAVAVAPGLAHLLELPNKIGLPAEQYLVAQQIYRGWALLGVVLFAALAAAATLATLLRRRGEPYGAALAAAALMLGALAVFFVFTFPANRATGDWTALPDDWRAIRAQWEYSHAAAALLWLGAFAALCASACARIAASR